MGVLTCSREKIVVATASNGQKVWVDLPYLADDLRKRWIEHSNMAFQQRINLAAFTARLASVGVCGNALGPCALLLFRDALEVPRMLAKSNPATLDANQVSIEELLPAVNAWMTVASYKLINLTPRSVNEYAVEDSSFG